MEKSIGAEQKSTETSDSIFNLAGELPCHVKIEESNSYSGEETNVEPSPYDVDTYDLDVKTACLERLESNLSNVTGECLVNILFFNPEKIKIH